MALLLARLTQKIASKATKINPILWTKSSVRYSTQALLNNARNTKYSHSKTKFTKPAPKSESERTYQQLYNQLTESQRSSDTSRVEDIFQSMRESPHINYSLFNCMFKYYLTTRQYDKGVQLYKSMTDLLERTSNKWLTPRITTAVLVLELLIRAREITLLYELIDLKLAAYHITPLDDIVAVCLKHNMPEAAVRVVESNKALLNTPAMTHLIIKLLQSDNESEALKYYRQMCVVGPAPNEVTFRELLLHFAKNRNMERIVQLLHDLHDHKFGLDSGTYTNVIRMMGMENASETRALLSPLIHTRTADTRTFNVMLALNKDNKLPVEYSLRLYDTMLAERLTPNVITYNTLFKLLHDAGRTEQLPRLLQEMRGHGVEFNEYTYGILAHSYVRARQYALAMQTLSEAESRGVRPNVELFNIKLMAYRAQGDVTKLRQVFFIDMPRANITPDAYSWSILLTASFKYEAMEEAEKLVELLQKSNVAKSVVNDVLYSHMIQMYKRKGQSDKITQLYLEQIKPRTKSIDRRLHTDLIESMPPSLHLVEVINLAMTKYGDFVVPLPVFHDTIRWLRQERHLTALRQLFRNLSIMGAKCHLPSQAKLLADTYGHVLLALIENDQSAAEIYAVFDQTAVQKLNLAGDVLESFVNLLVTRGDTANLTRVITLINAHHVTLSATVLSHVVVILAKNKLWSVMQLSQQLIEEQLPNLEVEALEHLMRISAANQELNLARAASDVYKSRVTSVNVSILPLLLTLEVENGSRAILALLERTQPPFPTIACSAEELKLLLRVAAEQRKLEWAQRLIVHNTAVTDPARLNWFVKYLPVMESELALQTFTEWWQQNVGPLQGDQYVALIESWGRLKSLKQAAKVYRAAEQHQPAALMSVASALLEVFIRAQVLAVRARTLHTQLSAMTASQVQEAMQHLLSESEQQPSS
jgi:pentatricopeptide repeat protein